MFPSFLLSEFSQSQNILPYFQKAAAEVNSGKLSSIQKDLEKLLEKHLHLKTGGSDVNVNINENVGLSNEVEYIIPKVPPYFNIAKLKSVDEKKKITHLEVPSQNMPAAVTRDGCAVNLKGPRLSDEIYGLNHTQVFVLPMHQLVLLDDCAHRKQCVKAMQNLYMKI